MDFNRPNTDEGVKAKGPHILDPRDPEPKAKRSRRNTSRRSIILAVGGFFLVLIVGVFAYWRFFVWQPADVDPFSARLMASLQFPLYYPTQIPTGFRVDTKSVSEPQQGVVVFSLIGPNGQRLYLSEEARPEIFDLGGFYNKFQDLKETPVSDGAIAVGRVSNGLTEIASRANNKTWVLSNTKANIPLDQLTAMLKSLTPSGT